MDRLSLDEEHYTRQEEWRRQLPESLGDGLRQGLSRLGISLLGMKTSTQVQRLFIHFILCWCFFIYLFVYMCSCTVSKVRKGLFFFFFLIRLLVIFHRPAQMCNPSCCSIRSHRAEKNMFSLLSNKTQQHMCYRVQWDLIKAERAKKLKSDPTSHTLSPRNALSIS